MDEHVFGKHLSNLWDSLLNYHKIVDQLVQALKETDAAEADGNKHIFSSLHRSQANEGSFSA